MKYLHNAVLARSHRILALLTVVVVSSKSQADDFTTEVNQPYTLQAQTWNDAIWEPGPVSPSADNTYEVLTGGCIWSPPLAGVQTFPGDTLIVDTDARIRVRAPFRAAYGTTLDFPGVEIRSVMNVQFTQATYGTTLNFPGVEGNAGLVLNGGKLQAADDCAFTIAGRIAVVTDSTIDHGFVTGNFVITAQIEGAGNLTLVSGSSQRPLDIRSSDNAYSGTWLVKKGYLKGTANGSLGTGNIIIASGAKLEVNYDIQTPATLTLLDSNSVMDLHQDCRFGAVIINDTPLAPGTYTYAELAAQFPGNFAADGSGSITVTSPADEITAGNDEVADSSMTTSEEETKDAMNLSLSPDVQTAADLSQLAPTAPSGVMVFANSTSQMTIQWNPSTTLSRNELAGYRVYRNGILIATTTVPSYTDTDLGPGTPYCYAITAFDILDKTSSPSAQACATTQSGVAALAHSFPSGLIVFATAPTQVMIFWNASTSDAGLAGYRVYRNGTLIATTTATSYADSGLALGIQYCYTIAAYDKAGNMSSSSAQACAPMQGAPVVINPPNNLAATAVGTNQIDLTWTDDSDNEEGFGIERHQPTTGTWILIATVGANTTSYSDVGLTPSTTFSYRIYAYAGNTY